MTVLKSSGRNIDFLLFLLFLTFFSSCSARIDGTFREGGAADITIQTSLEPSTLTLIRSLQNFMGDDNDTPVLDAQSISQSMAMLPGVRAVSLRNTDPSTLDGSISISNVEDFLAVEGAESRFISYTQAPGASSIVIILNSNTAPLLISRLSGEIVEHLSAFFAPVVTGDSSTRQEYLDLVSSIYGRPLAEEISAARILARIEFPRPIIGVQGGTFTARRAEFNIPLLDLLVLEHPLRYEDRW